MRETHSLMLMAAAALAKSVEKEKNAKNDDKDTVSSKISYNLMIQSKRHRVSSLKLTTFFNKK